MQERVAHLLFTVHAFQSLENAHVREQVGAKRSSSTAVLRAWHDEPCCAMLNMCLLPRRRV